MTYLILKFFFILLFLKLCKFEVLVKTNCGQFIGNKKLLNFSQLIYEFRGIPYAKAPVNSLRWKPSILLCEPDLKFTSKENGKSCYQMPIDGIPPILSQSEDCLNLKIFTRSMNNKIPKPVIFWIHGGSLVIGDSNIYGAIENLLLYEDVVIVSINYRLNIFGFLALSELSSVDPRGTSGNYGITDQLTALKWVKLNIIHFGEDPKKVTVLGQSSGGTSILTLLSSAESKGLFSSAISLSASPKISMTIKEAEENHRQSFLTKTLCKNKDILKCIYSLHPEEIVKLIPQDWSVTRSLPSNPK